MLSDKIQSKSSQKSWTTEKGTVFRVFEIYEESEKNENGDKPIFIKEEVVEKKKRLQ